MTSNTKSNVHNLVLIIGCRSRDVMGEDGIHVDEGCKLTSDEARVLEMNKLLSPRRARVITLNKQSGGRYKFHFGADVKPASWTKRFESWLQENHNGILQDVFLDYFFFQQNWYRLGYGTQWIQALKNLHFMGHAFLPIPRDPSGDPLDERDAEFHKKLIDGIIKLGGVFIEDRREIDDIMLCRATINANEELFKIDARMKSRRPFARNHEAQMGRIQGFLAISGEKIQAAAIAPPPAAAATMAATFTLETTIECIGRPSKRYKVVVAPSKGRYQIRLAGSLLGTRMRKDIIFSRTAPFGVNADFGKFIYQKLRQIVNKWRSSVDAKKWYEKKSGAFKAKVAEKFRARVAQKARRRRRPQKQEVVPVNRPLVSVAKKPRLTIALPDFVELRTGKTRAGAVQAIRVGKKLGYYGRNPFAYIYIPGALLCAAKGAAFTLGSGNGHNEHWMVFVADYLRYVVSKWNNFQQARNWILNHIKKFITLVGHLWQAQGGNVGGQYQVAESRRSTLPPDPEYVRKGWFPRGGDPGFGLYCTKAGQHKFEFNVEGVTKIVRCDAMNEQEGHYGANVDEEGSECVVPTPDSFKSGAIPHAFIVGHRRTDPTHYAVFDDDRRALLLPLRDAKVGEEYCFDYKYHDKRAKDYRTRVM